MEKRKGEDGDGLNDCRALVIWESSWHKIFVFMMGQSQDISLRDKALLLGMIGKALAFTWFVCLISDRINSVLILGLRIFFS